MTTVELPSDPRQTALAILERAIAAAREVEDPSERLSCLLKAGGVLALYSDTLARGIWEEAIGALATVSDAEARARLLISAARVGASVAPDSNEPSRLAEEAVRAVEALPDQSRKRALLNDMAYSLGALFPRVVAVALRRSPPWSASVMSQVVRKIAAEDPAAAYDLVNAATRGHSRALTFGRLAAALAQGNRSAASQALEYAVDAARDIEKAEVRVSITYMLAKAALGVAPEVAISLLEQAAGLAGDLEDLADRARLLLWVAGQWNEIGFPIPYSLLEESIRAAESIPDSGKRAGALASAAGLLASMDPGRANSLFDQAASLAQAVDDSERRDDVLSAVAEECAAFDIRRAVQVSALIADPVSRAQCFQRMIRKAEETAEEAADILRRTAIEQTVELPPFWRVYHLVQYADLDELDEATVQRLLDEAAGIVPLIEEPDDRHYARSVLLRAQARLDADKALALAHGFASGAATESTICEIAEVVASRSPERAVGIVAAVTDPARRCRTLCKIAERLERELTE